MNRHIRIIALSITLFFITARLLADSPITSTEFYKSYLNYPVVVKAHDAHIINDSIAAYLLNDSVAVEVKAAVINALSWDFNGKNNASLLMQYLIKKYNYGNGFDLNTLSADDIFCLGYLTIMDNYFQTEKPIKILTLAHDKKPDSFTINIILALAEAQQAMDTDFCKVYKICADVKKDKKLTKDMRQSAIDSIFEYINIYKESCKEK